MNRWVQVKVYFIIPLVFISIILLSLAPFVFQRQMYPFNNYNMFQFWNKQSYTDQIYNLYYMTESEQKWKVVPFWHPILRPQPMWYFIQSFRYACLKKVKIRYGYSVPHLWVVTGWPDWIIPLAKAEGAKILQQIILHHNKGIREGLWEGERILNLKIDGKKIFYSKNWKHKKDMDINWNVFRAFK